VLKKLNEKYLERYSELESNEFYMSYKNSISIKFLKEKQKDKNNVKIIFFTYVKNKKVDSIQFYRNFSGDGFGKYNCLSFLDFKNNKIWQLKYPVRSICDSKRFGIDLMDLMKVEQLKI